MMGSIDNKDDYATCVETFSTLRIFSDNIDPQQITSLLTIEPTKVFRKGDLQGNISKLKRKSHGWFFRTEGMITSRDTRRHLDVILKKIGSKQSVIGDLIQKGCKIDVMSYYISTGQGGPCLEPSQMKTLGKLNIPVWWDIYFAENDDIPAKQNLD